MTAQRNRRQDGRWSADRQLWLALVVCLVLLASALPVAPRGAGPAGVAAGQQSGLVDVIVVLKGTADPRAFASQANVTPKFVYQRVFRGFSARLPVALVDILARNPGVLTISQDLPAGVDRVDADQNPTAAIDGRDERVDADVAVLDTGIDPNHPDLNVVGGTD